MHVQELARALGAEADPELEFEIAGVATIEEAGAGQVTFLANPRYEKHMKTSEAAAVIVTPDFAGEARPALLRVANPYLAFAKAIELFHTPPSAPPGIHPTAVLGADVHVNEDVSIGAYVVIGDGVRIGRGTVIHPQVTIYAGASIGARCELHSQCVVREHVVLGDGVILQNGAIVGADGFGFAPVGDGSYHKIVQVGTVVLGDGVEIQANAAVDRAAVGATTLGRGTKVDNLVQVGHGCHVGEDTLLCGQSALAGSTEVGSRVTLAGQVGVAGHCRIGDDVILAAKAGVSSDLEGPGVFGGAPAVEFKLWRRYVMALRKLPEMARRLKRLERQVEGDRGGRLPEAGTED